MDEDSDLCELVITDLRSIVSDVMVCFENRLSKESISLTKSEGFLTLVLVTFVDDWVWYSVDANSDGLMNDRLVSELIFDSNVLNRESKVLYFESLSNDFDSSSIPSRRIGSYFVLVEVRLTGEEL